MLVKLPAAVTLAVAEDLRATLLGARSLDPTTTLDATDVDDVDVAGLQLLFALHRTVAESGRALVVTGAGARILEARAKSWGFPASLGCGATCPCRKGDRG